MGFKLQFEAERSGPVTEAIIGIPGVKIRIGMLALDDFSLELIQYIYPPGQKLDLRTNNVGCTHLAFFVNVIEKTYELLLLSFA